MFSLNAVIPLRRIDLIRQEVKSGDRREIIIHVHVGAINALVFLAYLIIIGTLLRLIATRYPDNPIGKAIQFIY